MIGDEGHATGIREANSNTRMRVNFLSYQNVNTITIRDGCYGTKPGEFGVAISKR